MELYSCLTYISFIAVIIDNTSVIEYYVSFQIIQKRKLYIGEIFLSLSKCRNCV